VFFIGVRVRPRSFCRATCLALPAWGCRGCSGIGRWGGEILAQRERFKPAVERHASGGGAWLELCRAVVQVRCHAAHRLPLALVARRPLEAKQVVERRFKANAQYVSFNGNFKAGLSMHMGLAGNERHARWQYQGSKKKQVWFHV
jgi:hypothetical protein